MTCSTIFQGIPIAVTLTTEPALGDLALMTDGDHADPNFDLTVTITKLDRDSRLMGWRLRQRDGGAFRILDFTVRAAVPVVDTHRMFVPVLHGAIGKLDMISFPWNIRERTVASWSFPLIAATSRTDENRFCVGFMNHVTAAEVSHHCYDEDAQIVLRRLFDEHPLQTTLWEETLYISRSPRHLFDEVRAFTRAYDTVNRPVLCETPLVAWEPVWCSWYGIKDNVTADYILGMVPLLKEWGFGSIIVDAGWFRPDMVDERIGHCLPDETKFPDLKGMIETVQAQGLRILLWCAPLFLRGGTDDHPFVRKHLMEVEGVFHDSPFLCPRSKAVREYATRMVDHLMRTYGIDGLKIDFIDNHESRGISPCTASHEHDIPDYGEAIYTLLKGIHDTVKAVRSDALIEFRMNYSNLVTRSFATSHRAQDAPFDFDHIRRMCTRLKSYIINPDLGKTGNVAVHTDPAYWLPEESPENVGRFMASLVTSGVPMLSMDLRALPPEHQGIVRGWLTFYKQHQDLLLFGTHRVLSTDPHFSFFSLHHGQTALWGVFADPFPGELRVPAPDIGSLWILNGTSQRRLFTYLSGIHGSLVSVWIYDRSLKRRSVKRLMVQDSTLLLDVEVEVGGAVELRVED
jgi:alpha-galactosidase